MATATYNATTLAESDDVVEVEGNLYFPGDSVARELSAGSDTHTTCPWKGEASYLSFDVEGETLTDAAWFYPDPKSAAESIRDRVAFGAPVQVQR